MHDVATMAKHFFNVADPDKTGFITLRMFEDVFRKLQQYRLRTSRRAKQTRRRHTELLRRMKRLMVASDCASTAEWFSAVSGHQSGRQTRKVLANVHVGELALREGIQKQVQESRRLDLAFQKADVTDLMRAVDVGAKGHVTLADMDNAIASLGDADKAVIDPKYALQPEHVAVLDRLDQFMASKTLRVEDLFNLIDINPAEDVITIQKFRAALARDFLPAPKNSAQRARAKERRADFGDHEAQQPPFRQPFGDVEQVHAEGASRAQEREALVRSKQEFIDTSGGGLPPWDEGAQSTFGGRSEKKEPNPSQKQATAYPRVEKLFGNHYKRVEETELRAVVMNLSGSIPANISGKPALLAHVEGILADQEMKEAASNTDSGLGDRPVPVPPAPVDTEQRHRAEITFNKGKLGFTQARTATPMA